MKNLDFKWLADELKIYTVDKVTENVIRRYITDLQERGKYTFYVNDLLKKKNYPDRRRDYRKEKAGKDLTSCSDFKENPPIWGRRTTLSLTNCGK